MTKLNDMELTMSNSYPKIYNLATNYFLIDLLYYRGPFFDGNAAGFLIHHSKLSTEKTKLQTKTC